MSICPKGHEYPEVDPYCCNAECLTYEIKANVLDPAGGVLTYVRGFKYPLRAMPLAARLDATAATKRALIATLRLQVKSPFFFLHAFLPKKKLLKTVGRYIADIHQADYEKKQLPYNELSESSREIFRALESIDPMGNEAWKWCLVMIYDTDLAYRFRGQDILGELNKVSLALNPRKEIMRLIDLALERNINTDVTAKLKLIRKVLNLALFCSPYITNLLADFLGELDISKIRLNINDKYWVATRFDYNYCGMTYEERMAWKEKENEGWVEEPPIPDTPRIVVNEPNALFYQLPLEEAEKMAEDTKQALIANYKNKLTLT